MIQHLVVTTCAHGLGYEGSLLAPILMCIVVFWGSLVRHRGLRLLIVASGQIGLLLMIWAVLYSTENLLVMHRHALNMVQIALERGEQHRVVTAIRLFKQTYERTRSDKCAVYSMCHELAQWATATSCGKASQDSITISGVALSTPID